MSAFASALRRNEQGKTNKPLLLGGTVDQIINNVCSVFRTNLRRSPIVDENGKRALVISRQIKGYVAEDPAKTHQKCLPIKVFCKLYRSRDTALAAAIGQLTTGALFFGMRSCEYSRVSGERKTKILQLKHLRFYNNNKEIAKTKDININEITKITITFHRQQNGTKEADITMHQSGDELCPVKVWGKI